MPGDSYIKEIIGSAGGDALFHFFTGGGKLFDRLGKVLEHLNKNNPRSEFNKLMMNIDEAERAVVNEIYEWWKSPKPRGAGKMENTFVTLFMTVEKNELRNFVSLIVREWKWNGEAGRKKVENLFYQLEHDVVDQYLKEFIVEPILKPINKAIRKDIRRKKARWGFNYKLKG